MKSLFRLRPLATALVFTAALTACNTGSETGATNVERGTNKSMDPGDMRPDNAGADSAASGLNPDTSRTTIQEQYENSSNAKDRNRDGLAD